MKLPRIAVVILHYGDPTLASGLHRQLIESDAALSDDIFVLDNCAPNPYPQPWLKTEENLYWAGAFEFAMQRIAALGYTHCWFLNNDISFVTGAPVIARVAARVGRIDKTLAAGEASLLPQHQIGVYAPSVLSNPYHPQMVHDPSHQYRTVQYVDGIAPLVSVACWKQLGGIDFAGNAYGYGVDVWMSLSARRAGWQVIVDHGVVIKHKYHSTAKTVSGFLHLAAQAEDAYLTQRMGADYRNQMNILKTDFSDKDRL